MGICALKGFAMQATGKNFIMDSKFNLGNLLELGLHNYVDACSEIVDRAQKELIIEKALKKIDETWSALSLTFSPYQDTDNVQMTVEDTITEALETDNLALQTMSGGKYVQVNNALQLHSTAIIHINHCLCCFTVSVLTIDYASVACDFPKIPCIRSASLLPAMSVLQFTDCRVQGNPKFLEIVTNWQRKLGTVDVVLNTWLDVQKKWQALESIFVGSADIRVQLPEDSKRFDVVNADFQVQYDNTACKIVTYKCCCYQRPFMQEISVQVSFHAASTDVLQQQTCCCSTDIHLHQYANLP